MDQTLLNIQALVNESNELFLQRQYDRAAAKAEKAYSLSLNHEGCSRATQAKIEFNLATIYTASNNESHLKLAKNWLDQIKSRPISFKRLNDIASLYTKLGNKLKNNPNRAEESSECYQMAFEYYAKTKNWLEYCLIGLVYARLLTEIKSNKKSVSVANKIVAATLYLRNDTELAKIYNDLATIYSKDIQNEESVLYAKRLLKKSLKLARNSPSRTDLEMCIYENLSAVCNQLERFDDSLKHINTAYQRIKEPNKYLYLLSDLKYNEGYARFMLNDPNSSIDAFKLSHQYALKTNQKNVYESLEALATVYSRLDQIETALETQEKAIKYFDYYYKLRNKQKSVMDENRLFVKRKQLLRCLHGDDAALSIELNDLKANLRKSSVHTVLMEENEEDQAIPEHIEEEEAIEVDRASSKQSSRRSSIQRVDDSRNNKDVVGNDERRNSRGEEIEERFGRLSKQSSRTSDAVSVDHTREDEESKNDYESMHEKLEVEYARSRLDSANSDGLYKTNETDLGTFGYLSDFRREIERQVREEQDDGNKTSSLVDHQVAHDVFEETRPFSPSRSESSAKSNMFQRDKSTENESTNLDLITNSQNTTFDEPCTSKQAELRDLHSMEAKQHRQVTIASETREDQLLSHYQNELNKEMSHLAQSSLLQSNGSPSDEKKNSNVFSIRNDSVAKTPEKNKSRFCIIS